MKPSAITTQKQPKFKRANRKGQNQGRKKKFERGPKYKAAIINKKEPQKSTRYEAILTPEFS